MSTSEENGRTLTRKQLREIRLTGSTPVITEEEAASAAAQPPTTVLPRAAQPIEIAPAPTAEPPTPNAPLTRRQMRALEHAHPVAPATESAAPTPVAGPAPALVAEPAPVAEPVRETVPAKATQTAPPAAAQSEQPGLVSGLPSFASAPTPASAPRFEPTPVDPALDDEHPLSVDQEQVAAIFEQPIEEPAPAPVRRGIVPEIMARDLMFPGASAPESDELPIVAPTPAPAPTSAAPAAPEAPAKTEPEPAPAPVQEEAPKVGAAFGIGVKADHRDPVAAAPFDALVGGTSSSAHHGTSTALIFTPSPGVGSLSGPIASTGEILVTGTYALPDGLGSQGHAHGTTDGKDIDAVLIDGELAPASSPTPIAASAAVSTSKPAGEVIRPPAPDKGNKLMLTLAIVAGTLAVVLGATLVIAFTTGVFG